MSNVTLLAFRLSACGLYMHSAFMVLIIFFRSLGPWMTRPYVPAGADKKMTCMIKLPCPAHVQGEHALARQTLLVDRLPIAALQGNDLFKNLRIKS